MTKAVPIGPAAVLQFVSLKWTKASRGGDGARARAAIPSVFRVPVELFAQTSRQILVIEADWGENNNFSEPVRQRVHAIPPEDEIEIGCISAVRIGNRLSLTYRYQHESGCHPKRLVNDQFGNIVPLQKRVSIGVGQWAQVRYNCRFRCVDTGKWWYEQMVANIAYQPGFASHDLFISSSPEYMIDLVVPLW